MRYPILSGKTLAILFVACLFSSQHLNASPLQQVRFDPTPGAQLPLDAQLEVAPGQQVPLGALLAGKPGILVFSYTRCPMLCPEVFNGLLRSLRALDFRGGQDYHVIAASFDPRDDAATTRATAARYSALLGGRKDAWVYATGTRQVSRLARAAGFDAAYDPSIGQYAHAAGFIVLTPGGRISHSFFGVEYSPRDLRLALMDAAQGQLGSWPDHLLFYCYRYSPSTGRYSVAILRILRICGAVTVFAIVALISILSRGG